MAGSRWQDIYKHLTDAGFEVHAPGSKVGECESAYLVLKNDGGAKVPKFSTKQDYYSIMCYVPSRKYSTLEPFVQAVVDSMVEMKPMIRSTDMQTGSYLDKAVSAHMISIGYKNYKKIS